MTYFPTIPLFQVLPRKEVKEATVVGVGVDMNRSSFSSSADSGVYGGSRSTSSSSLHGTYTISNPPGAAAFFNRPRQHQLDPNGNSIYNNHGFQDEVS